MSFKCKQTRLQKLTKSIFSKQLMLVYTCCVLKYFLLTCCCEEGSEAGKGGTGIIMDTFTDGAVALFMEAGDHSSRVAYGYLSSNFGLILTTRVLYLFFFGRCNRGCLSKTFYFFPRFRSARDAYCW